MPPRQSSANSFRLAEIGASRLVRLLGDWAHGPGALHEDLAGKVRHLIEIGAISPGTRLPSERALGSALNLSRNTVSKALDTIRSEGLLSSRQGDGTYVTYAGPRPQPGWADERLRSFLGGEVPSSRIDLRSAALPGLQMVADEMNLLDSSRLRELVGTHGYVPSGLPELRSAIADYYRALQLPTDLDQILVTSGAQQALRLVAASYVEPGATVLIEEPSFRGAIDVLTSLRARPVGVPSDHNGVDPDLLAAAVVEHHPVLILLQSTVHNPTGSVMDRLRRSRIVAIAERHGVPVLDDATLADTIIDGDRRPIPLGAGSDLVLTVGSMSKSFWGGLRVGWVRARADLIERLVAAKGGEDLGTSVVAQLLAVQLLPQIERARDERLRTLTESRRITMEALASALPDWRLQIPSGGGSLWVQIPDGSATSFTQRAERYGVQVLPGPTFSPADRLDDHLRVPYAADPGVILRGLELVAAAWHDGHHS